MTFKMESISWIRLFKLTVILTILHPGLGQETEIGDAEVPASKLESQVVTDMLRIVDHKFDTLTTRITALERAVSGLQFFSIRQFRQLSGNIQETQKDFGTVHKKIGQLEVDGRGLKISMSLLGRNVADLKTTTSDILGELESSVIYINDNVDKNMQTIEKTLKESTRYTERIIEKHFAKKAVEVAEVKKPEEDKPVNCTVDFTELAERIDVRFAEFKQQTYVHCAKLINDARTHQSNVYKRREREQQQEKEEKKSSTSASSRHTEPAASPQVSSSDSAAFSSEPESSYYKRNQGLPPQRAKLSAKERNNNEENEVGYGDDYDDRVMQLLFNMTTSVLQATSYFRHSSRVMEEILSNTGVLRTEQLDMQRDLGMIKLSLVNQSGTSTMMTMMMRNAADSSSNSKPPNQQDTTKFYNPFMWPANRGGGGGLKECKLSASALGGLETVVKNGSQLLEVLTDLAQMSSVSLTKATTSLQDEVKRVENLRTRLTTTLLSKFKELQSEPVASIKNNTQRILEFIEGVALNTGWLPLILRNVQQTSNVVNESFYVTSSNNVLLQKIFRLKTSGGAFSLPGGDGDRHLDNRIARIPPPTKNPLTGDYDHGDGDDDDEQSSEEESTNTASLSSSYGDYVIDRESLEVIFKTSKQLNRIMPALTKLLAEPDPLITLVGGQQSDHGRLEIYNRGQWGTICHVDLTHQEADAICRHIGFAGGISVGAGFFGRGSGIAWTLNTSCLEPAATCPIIEQLEDASLCNLDKAVALTCDHMLRINSGNDTVNNKIGRLEIHHKGFWLPICSEGWSGYAARVACKQMGFADGREVEQGEWTEGADMTWLSKVACKGSETRLDACQNEGWVDKCNLSVPAGVRCL